MSNILKNYGVLERATQRFIDNEWRYTHLSQLKIGEVFRFIENLDGGDYPLSDRRYEVVKTPEKVVTLGIPIWSVSCNDVTDTLNH